MDTHNKHVSSLNVQTYLKGIEFPASKDEIIECATENNAPEPVLYLLNHLQDKDFNSPADVSKMLGKLH